MSKKREITTRIMMAFGLIFAIFFGARLAIAMEPGWTIDLLLYIIGASMFCFGMDLRYKEDQ